MARNPMKTPEQKAVFILESVLGNGSLYTKL